MGKYISKKLIIYIITFFIAITINFIIPRMMPGDPITSLMSRFSLMEGGREILERQLRLLFNLDESLLSQYFNFIKSIFTGNMGVSIRQYPKPVMEIVKSGIIYDIILLVPAIILSWIVGNRLGAFSGVNKRVDNIMMPFFYVLTSSPYFWLAGIIAFVFGVILGWFPISGSYSLTMTPGLNIDFILDFLAHWIMPFLTLFLVQLGGWAIGMRNMIIYERSSNYSKYMESLGTSDKLIRSYGFRNGVLPQVTGLALRLGNIIGGAILVETVFNYPGLGRQMLNSILNQDWYLLQGIFLALVTMTLIANFLVDLIYMLIDPRIRLSYSGEV